jgi:ACS family sodium-dependent inorganic phosphate cotransporter
MGPAIFLVVATYSGCHRFISILMITVGLALMSFYYAGTRVNTLELAPNFSGVIMGLCNALATFVNIAVPYFVHQTAIHVRVINLQWVIILTLIFQKTVIDWRNLFYILFILVAFTNVVFMLFGSGKEQSWNMPKSENVPNE